MDRIKVLFITTWYPTKENPVEGIFVREHAKAVRLSNDVAVLHCSRRDRDFEEPWVMKQEGDENLTDGIPTFQVYYRQSRIPKTTYLVYLWSVIRAFQKIVNGGFRPDVIHAHTYKAGVPAVLVGKLYGIPVVITEQFTGFARKVLSRAEILKAMFAFRLANRVLPVTSLLQKAIEEYGIRAKFQVVPNVVETDLFFPLVGKDYPHDLKRLLFVGLLDTSHKKGIPYLLRALAHLQQQRKDWFLDIVGDGPARMEYEQAAAILSIADRITFHGMRSKQEVAEFMRQADLFVLPSLFETFSIVTAEALSTGIPVLATRCGGPEEFVNEDVGLVVPPGDEEALRKGLDYMMDNLEKFNPNKISSYAVERFNPDRIGEQLHKIYSECIAKYKG